MKRIVNFLFRKSTTTDCVWNVAEKIKRYIPDFIYTNYIIPIFMKLEYSEKFEIDLNRKFDFYWFLLGQPEKWKILFIKDDPDIAPEIRLFYCENNLLPILIIISSMVESFDKKDLVNKTIDEGLCYGISYMLGKSQKIQNIEWVIKISKMIKDMPKPMDVVGLQNRWNKVQKEWNKEKCQEKVK